ncbi:glycoside hydrolase family protein [Venturia nashicola]|uniref:alpha-1,2-Mannosidase n=1 Tax=Venturia nashicola TaxID=86259 RepID=A0A4Z1P7K9_9PEZI|nr:glycoside hydrolase family 47 protein [Venturia nashicola]TLD36426.1 glycoside hydrolase family protein [Venturia nashicola]
MPSFRRNPTTSYKLFCVVFIITFYLIYAAFHKPATTTRKYPKPQRTRIQLDRWQNGTGKADEVRKERVRKAMQHTFWGYKKHAWGHDDIRPVSGGSFDSRNGWGAFIVDTSTTLAMMGMWDELTLSVDFIIENIDFRTAKGLVDPFETTIRYLGALVSLVELVDAKVIPEKVIPAVKRKQLLRKTELLAHNLLPAYDSPTGMPWPRVDFAQRIGVPDPPSVYIENPDKPHYKRPAIGPARIGSNILENCVLSSLTDDWEYCAKATQSWTHLVWNKWISDAPGLVDAPIDIFTSEPVGRQKQWDAGHDSYYEYLIKASLLLPHSPNAKTYSNRWINAAEALRHNLSSRAQPSSDHVASHLYMGKINGPWFLNEQSHLACFAPGNLLLGGRHLHRDDLIILGKALLEGCRNSYATTATGIGPESWSWTPASPYRNGTFTPTSDRQKAEFKKHGLWVSDSTYRLRPEYVESVFYAWRVLGEKRYRDWAWEAFEHIEKWCKTEHGFAGLKDVMHAHPDHPSFNAKAFEDNSNPDAKLVKDNKKSKPIEKPREKQVLKREIGPEPETEARLKSANSNEEEEHAIWLDESESFWGAETLKYLWLTFEDVGVGSLDQWIFSTEGHMFRRPP